MILRSEFEDAIAAEIEQWPGVTLAFEDGSKHPVALLSFDGLTLKRPYAGTPSDSRFGKHRMLGDVRRALRDLGAARAKPVTAADDGDDVKLEYRKPNGGKAAQPSVAERMATDLVVSGPTMAEQVAAVASRAVPPDDDLPPPDVAPGRADRGVEVRSTRASVILPAIQTLEDRTLLAKGDGWLGVGEHDIPGERYHLDPCETPSLSASIAKVALEKSLWHAWTKHPRLNEDFETADSAIFRKGRAFHTMLLGAGAPIQVFDHRDWKKELAKADKADAVANGFTPMLAGEYRDLEAMVRAVKRQINAREELAYAMAGGVPERVFIWQEETPSGPIWCRMMADWTPHSGRYAVDWKSTGVSAGPNGWGQKTMWDSGCDIQDAFYRRGYKAVLGRDFDALIFAVAETEAPFAMMHHRVDFEAQEQADIQVQWAINAWGMCIHRDRWPGYPTQMAWQSKPGWRAQSFEARRDSGMMDTAMLDEQMAALKQIAEMPRDVGGGVPMTDDNVFGLAPIGDDRETE